MVQGFQNDNFIPNGDRAADLGSTTQSWDNIYCDGISFDDGTTDLNSYLIDQTWTPAVSFGGGTTGITYSAQNGRYSKIGKLVIANGSIILTSKGTSTGNASITGLPFVADTTLVANYIAILSGALTLTLYPAFALVVSAAQTATLFQSNAAATPLNITDVNFAATTSLFFTFTYIAST